MLGFKYLRNFNYPYISKSITEFWRRWHISLSTFFRDYIYIPLGGSRVSTGRWAFNLAVVWSTTGLWHGAAWNYVLWGIYYGALLILEKLVTGKLLQRLPRFLQHTYTLAIVVFGWSFFWITDNSQLVSYWAALFGAYGPTGSSTLWQLNVWEYWPILAVCTTASLPVAPYIKETAIAWFEGRKVDSFMQTSVVNPRHIKADKLAVFSAAPSTKPRSLLYQLLCTLCDIALLGLFALSAFSIIAGSYNPFIYFQF